MVTNAQTGSLKPKTYHVQKDPFEVATCYIKALAHREWCKAMEIEVNALFKTVDPYFVMSMCIEAVGNPMMKNYMTVRCNWKHGAELLIPWHDLEKIKIIIKFWGN